MDLGTIVHLADADEVAKAAASDAALRLRSAIAERGSAVWVIAGGSSPMAAYRMLAEHHAHAVDWSRVSVIIGDERMVPLTDAASNLGAIMPVLLADPRMAAMTVLCPQVESDEVTAAAAYARALRGLSDAVGAAPVIDLVWLGVGEDGHTLSLFPGHPDFVPTAELVVPVRDSPKPPAVRITLTRAALDHARRVVIFATGAGKRAALAQALSEGMLPIARVAEHARGVGAEVTWLFDAAASS